MLTAVSERLGSVGIRLQTTERHGGSTTWPRMFIAVALVSTRVVGVIVKRLLLAHDVDPGD